MATYEYFKKDPFVIRGKYADYVDALWKQNKIQESCFRRLIDLYVLAAMVGIRTGRKLDEDVSNDNKRTVQLEQIVSKFNILRETMRLMILFDDSDGSDAEERIRAAFSEPSTEEEYRKYMDMFNSYALGGIDYIYNAIIVEPAGPDDEYTGKTGKMLSLLKKLVDDAKEI